MKAKPAEVTPRGEQWVYELKWDGMRVVLFIAAGKVRAQSSNLRDVSASYPELASLGTLNEDFESVVLDGEIVAFDDGRPSFNALQSRMHVADPSEASRRSASTPVLFVAFDLLHLNGHDTTSLPLHNRRSLLQQINDENPAWTISEQYHDDDLDSLLDVVVDRGSRASWQSESTRSTNRGGDRRTGSKSKLACARSSSSRAGGAAKVTARAASAP